jgi:hypothetical protein
MQMKKIDEIAVVQCSVQYDEIIENKRDGLVTKEDQNLTNQVHNISLVVNILQINP